jgi:hypothetical protein
MTGERLPTIEAVRGKASAALDVTWSDGTRAKLDLSGVLKAKGFRKLKDAALFARAKVGEWGHSVEWPGEIELSAETLWLETLSATGKSDTRAFLEWRLAHGLSLSAAAEALGLSRRMVAYYSSGEKRVPKAILLACKGWEVEAA